MIDDKDFIKGARVVLRSAPKGSTAEGFIGCHGIVTRDPHWRYSDMSTKNLVALLELDMDMLKFVEAAPVHLWVSRDMVELLPTKPDYDPAELMAPVARPPFFDRLNDAIRAGLSLYDALEMVRDADEDCKRDFLPTMPAAARAMVDAALAEADKSLAQFRTEKK